MPREQVAIVLRTAGGDVEHRVDGRTLLVQACRMLHVPPGAVSPFVRGRTGLRRATGMHRPIEQLVGDGDGLVLQFDRNINYLALLTEGSGRTQEDRPGEAVTEYAFPAGVYGHVTHAELTEADCRRFVLEAVTDFVEEQNALFGTGRRMVVGTSGGGDSNALLSALAEVAATRDLPLMPVMLLGIPEWDGAAERGSALCHELGLDLAFLDSGRVNQLLGRPASAPDWLGDFRRHFPDDDVDVIGTLAIRLGLADAARRSGTGCVITGLNLEDLLAECFLRLVQGELPLAFPVRVLDGLSFCYPLHRVPKKILDGCHPRYALANYQERSTGVMMGRAIRTTWPSP